MANLPQADEYQPELIGTAEVEAREPIATFPEYGLEVVPIYMDGSDTGRRFIRRNGELIADVSEEYNLTPNEIVVDAANTVAEKLGAVPFHDFSGDWFVKLDDHVFQDEDGRRVHALYAWDDPVSIGGDEVQMGFAVHNSIDRSLSFQTGLFTFRHACANMVMMGVKGKGMSFDEREIIAWGSAKHTKGLEVDVESLASRVEQVLALSDEVSETYRAWRDQYVKPGHVEQLIRSLPHKDLPLWALNIKEDLERAKQNADLDAERLPEERKQTIFEEGIPRDQDVWTTYNTLTEAVWHDEGTNDVTKQGKMRKIHAVFPPAKNVR